MPTSARAALQQLSALRPTFGEGVAARKVALLDVLAERPLRTADEVLALHECLLFLRAYPDDAEVLARVADLLEAFAARVDLQRHAEALTDSGIAGTRIEYAFFFWTALWLARRHPGRLHVDWASFTKHATLCERLWLMMPYSEELALAKLDHPLERWVAMLKRDDETDAEFLVRRMEALRADAFTREFLADELEMPMWLEPGTGTPSRTSAHHPRPRIHFQTAPLDTRRPDLGRELGIPPHAVRAVARKEGQRLVDLAREAMITRSRDLDGFIHADARDVRLVDCGDGLEFAAMGMRPERRLLLESMYGFLTLKNGVPIGYVLATGLNASSEIMYNVFEANRGGEAARIYGRILAMVGHLLGSTAFSVDPYQLGHDNSEGQESGAWWFYYKLGFRPVDREILRLVREEQALLRRRPRHRSGPATLQRLSADSMYWFADGPREDVLGRIDLNEISLGVARATGRRFGSDRERATQVLSTEAQALLGVRSFAGWTPGQRLWWARWSPLVMALPGVRRWSAASRRGLVQVIRAKGGRRESDYNVLLNAHRPLRRALLALSRIDHAAG